VERRRPGWFLDMKYQTCLSCSQFLVVAVLFPVLISTVVITILFMNGNRTPGSRSSLDTWAVSVCIHQFLYTRSVKVVTSLLVYSRSYSDPVDTWADSVGFHQLVLTPHSKAEARLRLIPINAHLTRWPCCSSWTNNGCQREDKTYYSTHNFVIGMSFTTYVSVHNGNHGSVVRIFVGLSWELYCQRKPKRVPKQWQLVGRHNCW